MTIVSIQIQEYIGNDDELFSFLTNFDAPKHRVIQIDIVKRTSIVIIQVIE